MKELRPFQREALDALQNPVHLLCIAPTGSGKSLIYERMAIKPGYRTVLVSPLVALARQQAERLGALGIPVSLGAGDSSAGPPRSKSGVWIISPEKLWSPHSHKAASDLRQWRPNFLAVDECHCLWEWGDEFRPAFSRVPELIRGSNIDRSLWLTATLPYKARTHLRERISQPLKEMGSFALPEKLDLEIRRVPWINRAETLLTWIREQDGAGIVFVSTRDGTLRVSRLLQETGTPTVAYHAGMSAEERRGTESRITGQGPKVIVATSAFGMGMDHAHLRWVVMWQAPSSLLALAQGIGRVGRSNTAGNALVLWDTDDFRLLEWTVRNSERRKSDLLDTYQYLSSKDCRRVTLAKYFEGVTAKGRENCGHCDYCDG